MKNMWSPKPRGFRFSVSTVFVQRIRLPVAAFVVTGCFVGGAHALPSFNEVKADHRTSESQLLSREGEVLQRLRTDSTVRRGPWVELADISPALRTALVLSEDKRFYEHSGVDWAAVTSAAWGNLGTWQRIMQTFEPGFWPRIFTAKNDFHRCEA